MSNDQNAALSVTVQDQVARITLTRPEVRNAFNAEVTSAEVLDVKMNELTQALVSASPNATRVCKKLVQDVAEREINDALVRMTVEGIADIRASSEGKEGVQSFLQKRKPNWLQ